MATWVSVATDHLWRSGLTAVPLVLLAATAMKLLPCRPATRHLMWLMVLLWPLVPPLLPSIDPWVRRGGEDAVAGNDGRTAPAAPPYLSAAESSLHGVAQFAATPNAQSRLIASVPVASARTGLTADHVETSLPSPRSGARTASAKPDLLAQPRGAVGLPPIDHRRELPQPALRVGPTCPLPSPDEPVCRALRETGLPHAITKATKVEGLYDQRRENHDRVAAKSKKAGIRHDQLHDNQAAGTPEPAISVATQPESPCLELRIADMESGPPSTSGAPSTSESSPLAPVAIPVQSARDSAESGIQQWVAAVVRLRDDLALLPAFPNEIWLSGTLLLLLAAVVRVAQFRRLLHSARPAPSEVVRLVADASRDIGLRAVPQTWMVGDCVSPMVWCAIRPRLLLPQRLWSELDPVGRRAVILHELAHLRRRDHWVLWADSLVGSLYWWHPVVWWVRRRLRLEAEYCCDAWVTTLLPRTRRAYAEALLKTRQYLGEGSQTVPAMGMGVSSGRAKRFARRLTMVMTTSTKPGASIWGVSLVLLMATSGWLASPARSCPNKETQAGPCNKVKGERVEAKQTEQTTFEKHMAERARRDSTDREAELMKDPVLAPALQIGRGLGKALGGLTLVSGPGQAEQEERIKSLQADLARLGRQLEQLNKEMNGQRKAPRAHGGSPHEHAGMPAMPGTPAPPAPPAPMGAPVPPTPPSPPTPRAFTMTTPRPGSPTLFPKAGQTWADISDEKVEWRAYKLPPGKLEDFIKFMSRSDVPILVRPAPGAIEIRATPPQHDVFRAFFQIVDPSEERADAGFTPPWLSGGGWRMEPRFVPGQGMAWGLGPGQCTGCNDCHCGKCQAVRERRASAERIRGEARAMADGFRAKAHGEGARVRAEARARADEFRDQLRQQARRIRLEAENQEELIRSLEKQADTLREQSDRMRERAERIRERAERVRERRQGGQGRDDGGEDETGGAFEKHIDVLERNAEGLTGEADEVHAKVAEILERMQAVQDGSEELERHADEVERRADAIAELSESIEGIEAGPELAMSMAELAARLQHLAAPASPDTQAAILSDLALRESLFHQSDEQHMAQFEAALEAAAEAAVAQELSDAYDSPEDDDDEDNDEDDDDDDDEDEEEDDNDSHDHDRMNE